MILLTLRNNDSTFTSFIVEGHSSTGQKGNNILCAGVSTLVQTILLGISSVLQLEVNVDKRDGYLLCELPQSLSQQEKDGLNLLIMTMIIGIKDLKQQYPDEIEIIWEKDSKIERT